HSRNVVFALRHDVTRVILRSPQDKENLDSLQNVNQIPPMLNVHFYFNQRGSGEGFYVVQMN
ncbi:MAG: hypothetical protein VXZ52_00305, partial [Candidatus Thermoplasmatota archaeon]|nr:hypothetical protein [Candidatus Thermoplasmatota archaeon]